METKTFWVECRLDESSNPCFFPGHNLDHAIVRAKEFFAALSIPWGDIIVREYFPRTKIVTKRKMKHKRAKHAIAGRKL